MLNHSGYVRSTAISATSLIYFRLFDLAHLQPYGMVDRVAFMKYTITRIRLSDEGEIQIVTRERIPFPGEHISLRQGMYRACLIERDELVEVPVRVEGNRELRLDATYMSLEDQWANQIRHRTGPTNHSPLIGTLRENPALVPTDEELIYILKNLCILTGQYNTAVPNRWSPSSEEDTVEEDTTTQNGTSNGAN